MPRNLNSTFENQKNQQRNKPIFLYSIEYTSGNWLYYAEWSENIVFDGTTYTAFPISHDYVGENIGGEIDQVQITVANVSRVIQTYLENYDGLRGCQVNIKMVWADHLNDTSAYIKDVFYVESTQSNQNDVTLILTSKFDLERIKLPKSTFQRNRCRWKFKSAECGYNGDTFSECNKTLQDCRARNNVDRIGTFPSIPSSGIIIS